MDPLGEEIPHDKKNFRSLMDFGASAGPSRVATGGRRAGLGRQTSQTNDPLSNASSGSLLGGVGPLDTPPLAPARTPDGGDETTKKPVTPDIPPAPAPAKNVPKLAPAPKATAKLDSDDDSGPDLPDDSALSRPERKTSVSKEDSASLPWLQEKQGESQDKAAPKGASVPAGRRQMLENEKQEKLLAEREREKEVSAKQREDMLRDERIRIKKEVEDELRAETSRLQQEHYSLTQQIKRMNDEKTTENSRNEAKSRELSDEIARLERNLGDARFREERQESKVRDLEQSLQAARTASVTLASPVMSTTSPGQAAAESFRSRLEGENLDSKLQVTADRIAERMAKAQEAQMEVLFTRFTEKLQKTEENVLKHRDGRLHIEQAERMRLLEEERDAKLRMEVEERAERLRRDKQELQDRREREDTEAARRHEQEREERAVRMKKDIEERELWMKQERERGQAAMSQALERLSVQHKLSEEHYLRMSQQQAKEMEARYVSERIQMQHAHKAQMEAMTQRFTQLQQLQEGQHKKSLEAMSLHAENATSIRETWSVLQKNVEGLSHIRMVFERQEAVFQQEREAFNREREMMMKELTHNLVQQHSAVEREKSQLSNMLTEVQTIFSTQNETLNEERNKLALLMKKGEAQRQMWEKEHRVWMNERNVIDSERNEVMAHVKHALASFTEERRKLQQSREDLDGMKERLSQEAATRQEMYDRQQMDLDERMHKARAILEGEYNHIREAEADLAQREEDFQKRTVQLRGAAAEVQRRAEEAEMGMRSAEQKLEVAERVRESLQKNNAQAINASSNLSSSDDERQRLRRERRDLEEERLRLLAQQNERLHNRVNQGGGNQRPQPGASTMAPASVAVTALPQRSINENQSELDRRIDHVLSMYPSFTAPRYRWDPSTSMNQANPMAFPPTRQGPLLASTAQQTSFTTNVSTSTHNQTGFSLPNPNLTNLVAVNSDHDTTTTSSRYGGGVGLGGGGAHAPSSSVGKASIPTPSIFTTESS